MNAHISKIENINYKTITIEIYIYFKTWRGS